ncbi:MAG: hypothetical protein QMD13_07130 [Candidatus Bathyarchaeia archaeon]|nr:hypothetical protein [Candidatus Bathyarchaeia archaeon]
MKARKIKGRWMILRQELDKWKENRDYRLIKLGMEDYFKAFNFAVKQFYRGGLVVVEWGKTKRREIGEFLFNQMGGKLGELAFREFLRSRFGVEVRVSFEVEKELPGQDIFKVKGRSPKVRVSIKTTKIQNFNLWVVEEDIDLSDAYVLCRVDLPLDHLLRVLREHEKLSEIRDIIPELHEVEAEVVGFAWKDELKAKGSSMEMIGADGKLVQELRRPQYVMLSGELKRTKKDWESLVNTL